MLNIGDKVKLTLIGHHVILNVNKHHPCVVPKGLLPGSVGVVTKTAENEMYECLFCETDILINESMVTLWNPVVPRLGLVLPKGCCDITTAGEVTDERLSFLAGSLINRDHEMRNMARELLERRRGDRARRIVQWS